MLESIFLKNKSILDMAECRIIVNNDKHFSLEIYHQLKANEILFDEAVAKYGIGSTKSNLGFFPMQPVGLLPYGLDAVVSKLQPGQITMPMRYKESFCIIKLNSFVPSKLDQKMENTILSQLFMRWLDDVTLYLLDSCSKQLSYS